MTELRERDGKKDTYSLEPTRNGAPDTLEKKLPPDGEGGGQGVKLKRQVRLG